MLAFITWLWTIDWMMLTTITRNPKTISVITTNATRLSMWVTLSIIIGYKDPFGGLAQGVHKEQQPFGQ